KTALQSISSMLKSVLVQLGATVAKAAALAVVFQAFGLGPAGSTFKSLFQGFSGIKLGDGGIVSGPTIAMIGERGPEAVIPLGYLDNMIARAPQEVYVRGEISGDVIKLINDRQGRRGSRLF